MRTTPFESAKAKINRAKDHLSQLNEEIKADGAAKKYGISFHRESQTNELVIRALMPRDLSIRYSILVSEIVGHTRSALEHAVWQIVPAPKEGRTGFPVFRFKTRSDTVRREDRYYDRDGLRMIQDINASAGAIIEAAQPFGPDYNSKPLYLLNELWNTDKHRFLNFCASYPDFIAINYMPLPLGSARFEQRFVKMPRQIKDGTELFRETDPGPEMDVVAEVAFSGIVFRSGPAPAYPVSDLLLTLVDFADGLVDDLAKTV
jgi:hypothetical protein